MKKRHRYTEDEIKFLSDIAKNDKSREEIAKIFNREFNLCISEDAIMAKCCSLGLTKERTYRKKFVPAHKKSVNDESIYTRKNGRKEVLVKVSEPDVWKLKSRVIWEKHNGKIPEGHIVIFLDGDTQNFDLKNLALVPRAVNARINQNGYRTNNAELTKAGIQAAEILAKIGELSQKEARESLETILTERQNKILEGVYEKR